MGVDKMNVTEESETEDEDEPFEARGDTVV